MRLLHKELKLAGQLEMMKQDLACSYDFNLESLYHEIDDCNFRFIDTCSLKRFIIKAGLRAPDAILIAIIRRMDLDADARLSKREFMDGVQPIENFTKGTLNIFKKELRDSKRSKMGTKKIGSLRPMTGAAKRSTVGDVLHNGANPAARSYISKNDEYA